MGESRLLEKVETALLAIYRVGAAGGDGHPALAKARAAIREAIEEARRPLEIYRMYFSEGCGKYGCTYEANPVGSHPFFRHAPECPLRPSP